MRSYVKIYGPPLYDAVKALEKMAIDMPEVCIMNTFLELSSGRHFGSPQGLQTYFGNISEERCGTILSKSGEKIGENDFYFEWFKQPTLEQLNILIKKIDETLTPIGVKYTLITR